MKLSTGKVAFPIEFDNGDKDVIYFNPNDPDIIQRLKNFQSRVEDQTKDLKDIQLQNDGTPIDRKDNDIFQKIKEIMCSEIDIAFNSNISQVIFKHCSPFAIVEGEWFVVQFLNAVAPEIERHIEESAKDIKAKMDKHMNKYK